MAFLKTKDILDLGDLTTEEIFAILSLARKLKDEGKNLKHYDLEGKSVGLIFSKPSTRTRVSFEVGISQIGGTAVYLQSSNLQIKRGESIADTAKVLSSYLDAIVIRTYAHEEAKELAKFASISVINALTDFYHPCQALTDLFTVQEKKNRLKGVKMAYFGDGNNVCHSLIMAASKVGVNLSIATPFGFEPLEEVVKVAKQSNPDAQIEITNDPKKAVQGADVLYTDVWISMGQEEEKKRLEVFRPYQINKNLLGQAKPDAIVMHCLPAHRGQEITAEVLDNNQSVIFDQAENRLHAQKALLIGLIG